MVAKNKILMELEEQDLSDISYHAHRFLLGYEMDGYGSIYRVCKTFDLFDYDALLHHLRTLSEEHYLKRAAYIYYTASIPPKIRCGQGDYIFHFIREHKDSLKFPTKEKTEVKQ